MRRETNGSEYNIINIGLAAQQSVENWNLRDQAMK